MPLSSSSEVLDWPYLSHGSSDRVGSKKGLDPPMTDPSIPSPNSSFSHSSS